MRLIGTLSSETEAFSFFAFLKSKGIDSSYEEVKSTGASGPEFAVWVFSEEDLDAAAQWLEEYRKNPKDARFSVKVKEPSLPKEQEENIEEQQLEGIQVQRPRRPRATPRAIPITKLTILVCLLLFFWNSLQKKEVFAGLPPETKIILLTPLEGALMYDYPLRFLLANQLVQKYPEVVKEGTGALPFDAKLLYQKLKNTPVWQGVYSILVKKQWAPEKKAPPFEKIRQGQLWRLFTPCLLHGGLLHILFNMLWAYVLGKQIEVRVGAARYIALIFLLAVGTNSCQYLMSGPLFLGYSGVIAGFAGFIWMRQKVAPWEGYPIHGGTLLFLGVFILGMALFQTVVFFLQLFNISDLSIQLANTAHVTGALFGILLAKVPLFSKGV